MSESVLRLTADGRNELLRLVESNPELWKDPETDFAAVLQQRGVTDYAVETGAVAAGPITLPTGEGYTIPQRSRMDRHAPTFCDLLQGLTPQQAADGRVWEWLTHFRLHRYSYERWPNARVAQHIQLHWFIRNQRDDLYQHNTASRTYWVGVTAARVAQASGGTLTRQQIAEHLSENPVTYHNIMESSMTHNPRLAALVLEALTTAGRGEGLNWRGSIALWKQLNLAAGKFLPEAMGDHDWNGIIDEKLDGLMREAGNVKTRRHLRGSEPYRVLSLGAGVQSTVMALMAEKGELGMPKPDIALFADTQWEPPAVYEHLEWLKTQVSFEIRTISAGNIKANLQDGVMPDGSKFIGIPAFLDKGNGETAIMRRQCTTHYKLKPIHQEIRKILELPPGRAVPKRHKVEMWVGISVDEITRAKPSAEEWIEKKFPLIDLGISRPQLHQWFQKHYPGRPLPKSACIGCPYHSDAVWKDMKETDPASFMDAVQVDIALRANPNITALTPDGQAYLHRSRKPLPLVNFDETTGYQDQMNDECEGLCGI